MTHRALVGPRDFRLEQHRALVAVDLDPAGLQRLAQRGVAADLGGLVDLSASSV